MLLFKLLVDGLKHIRRSDSLTGFCDCVVETSLHTMTEKRYDEWHTLTHNLPEGTEKTPKKVPYIWSSGLDSTRTPPQSKSVA